MKVAIIVGSRSDSSTMKPAADILRQYGLGYSSHVLSAHRVPELLKATISKLENDGVEVFIAAAGLAAHLPGVIASLTTLPVIGVPLKSGSLGGMDALLSVVQMPKPIPVATVGIDNAANAAYLACQILALKYPELAKRVKEHRLTIKNDFAADSLRGIEL